jgi:site-specific DNA recombinase
MTLRAAIYARKSTTVGLDSDFSSLDNQTESCRALIKARGWTPIPTLYSDGGFSGGTTERPAFQRLLADCTAAKLDVIVVHRLDRFSRSVADFARLLDDLKRQGIAVVSVTDAFDTSTAAGTLMLNIIISMAQWEREAASERLRAKFAATRRKGLFTGGTPPFGYGIQAKRLVIDPAEAEAIRLAFTEAARGTGPTQIARLLNDRAFRTRTGTLWHRQRVQSCITNRIYLGQIKAGTEWVEAQHEAIIDLDTYEQAQRQHRSHRPTPHKASPHLLSGLIRCLRCGARYHATATPANAQGKRPTYYTCPGRNTAACKARSLRGDAIEDFVIDHIRDRIDDGFADEVLAGMQARTAAETRTFTHRRADLERQITQAERDTRELAEAIPHADHAPARAILQAQLDDTATHHTTARLALAELEVERAELDAIAIDAEWVANILRDWDRLWALLTPPNRHRLIRAVVREIRIDEPGGIVEVDLIDFTHRPRKTPHEHTNAHLHHPRHPSHRRCHPHPRPPRPPPPQTPHPPRPPWHPRHRRHPPRPSPPRPRRPRRRRWLHRPRRTLRLVPQPPLPSPRPRRRPRA